MIIGKYNLDREQTKVVKDESKNLLVVAGAGSGKTLTILGKISYLINFKYFKTSEILCISFTNAASNSLKEKIKKELNLNINVFTFHKLALEILKNKSFSITQEDTLENIINVFFEEVKEKPKNFIFKYLGVKNICEYLKKEKEIINFKMLITVFIHLFKSNDYKLEEFLRFYKNIKKPFNILNYKKEKLFLIITLNIYLQYQKYLEENNEIDFDDMLIFARKNVNNTSVINNIKCIIIDEFQDTSLVRFNLIKEILNKTNALFLAVGDDFQSIYRFTGCDLSLFVNFKSLFSETNILKIQNTYRNSDELIKIAGDFIMKNKTQINKSLKSNKHLDKPIEIIYFKNEKITFKKLLIKIYKETNKEILVLARNNKDIYKYITKEDFFLKESNLFLKENNDLIIKYMTVHKSKGLESENVIVLNMIDDLLGFPSKIKNDGILRLVSTKSSFLYDEERRLFYVALTRTKNKVYLLTKKGKESIFIKELIRNYKSKIKLSKESLL